MDAWGKWFESTAEKTIDNGGFTYDDLNLKVNECLYRRVDLADAVDARILAGERVAERGFRRYIVSATTPFEKRHISDLRTDAASVVRSLIPDYENEYRERGWRMFQGIDRVYVNRLAREELGWTPRFDFRHVLECLGRGDEVFRPLARAIGIKGYQAESFEEGPHRVEGGG